MKGFGKIQKKHKAVIDGIAGEIIWDKILINEITFVDSATGSERSLYKGADDKKAKEEFQQLVNKYGITVHQDSPKDAAENAVQDLKNNREITVTTQDGLENAVEHKYLIIHASGEMAQKIARTVSRKKTVNKFSKAAKGLGVAGGIVAIAGGPVTIGGAGLLLAAGVIGDRFTKALNDYTVELITDSEVKLTRNA